MQEELYFLEEQGVDSLLIEKAEDFRREYSVSEEVKNRVAKPPIPFYGKEILEMSMAALLQGSNLLLSGAKNLSLCVISQSTLQFP